MRTKQDIFDYRVRKLAKQGGPSREEVGHRTCRYRSSEGRKCAFGWFIPDEKYSSLLEGCGVISLFNRQDGYGGNFRPKDVVDDDLVEDFSLLKSLFSSLQAAHDGSSCYISLSTGQTWKKPWGYRGIAISMAEVAKRFELNDDVVAEMWPKDHGVVVA